MGKIQSFRPLLVFGFDPERLQLSRKRLRKNPVSLGTSLRRLAGLTALAFAMINVFLPKIPYKAGDISLWSAHRYRPARLNSTHTLALLTIAASGNLSFTSSDRTQWPFSVKLSDAFDTHHDLKLNPASFATADVATATRLYGKLPGSLPEHNLSVEKAAPVSGFRVQIKDKQRREKTQNSDHAEEQKQGFPSASVVLDGRNGPRNSLKRDQTNFLFDRDDFPDPSIAEHLVWDEDVPVVMHQHCNDPSSRSRDNSSAYVSSVFIPDKPRLGPPGLPVGGCGIRAPDGQPVRGRRRLDFQPPARRGPLGDLRDRRQLGHAPAAGARTGDRRARDGPADKQRADPPSLAAARRLQDDDILHESAPRPPPLPRGRASAPGLPADALRAAHDEVRNKLLPSLKKRFRTAQLLSPAFLVRAYTSWFKLRAMVQERELKRAGAPLPKALLRRKPMSGFFAAVFAAQVCDRIDLYGFANWTKG
eukprot:CAMPEP_0177616614 /NCGR_PEP_ID=MMETSP0419_2-20121207/24278_1 /TAXON_ID=582737 /ORGANISM="Tetraselmis sp., Strain GSL018" /LENGTH=476 /DNA_ID=CAMNT_0019114741 /DNA_START=483 /DNA_END=1910 /DNA_ORIENTATION=+